MSILKQTFDAIGDDYKSDDGFHVKYALYMSALYKSFEMLDELQQEQLCEHIRNKYDSINAELNSSKPNSECAA